MVTVAAAREAEPTSRLLAKVAKKAGSSASWGERLRRSLTRFTSCLVTRLHNFPAKESFLPGRHFFMVSPGEVASPFLSTAPAVPAPYVLASFGERLELLVVAGAPRTHASVPLQFQSAQERHDANRHGRCGGVLASCVQVCRRRYSPECATARKRKALNGLRQDFGRRPCPARYDG